MNLKKLIKKLTWPDRKVTWGIVIFVLAVLALFWRLSSITNNKLSINEIATKHNLYIDSPWWKSLNYISGPYYLLLHATFKINHSVFDLRLASVLVGLISIMLVYWLITEWHGYKIAVLATAIYLTNFGLLIVSRQAILYSSELLVPIALLFVITLLNRDKSFKNLIILIVVISGSLYIPGGLWLVITALIISNSVIRNAFKQLNINKKISLITLNILLLFPLAYRLIVPFSEHQFVIWLGYGLTTKLSAISIFAKNIADNFLDLFIHSVNLNPTLSLGHLPIMPVAESLIGLIGIIFYVRHISNWRWRNWLILTAILLIITGFGEISVFSLLPLISISIGTGLAYLLKEWYSVFPFNPFARYTGYILMALVVAFSCFYSARSYYVAWANDPSSASQYIYKP